KKIEVSAFTAAEMGISTMLRSSSRINSFESRQSSRSFSSRDHIIHGSQPRYTLNCTLCGENHKTIFCKTGTPAERNRKAIQKKLCLICLKPGHETTVCRSPYQCHCGDRHSSAICVSSSTPNITPRI